MIYKTQSFISPSSIFNLMVHQQKGVVVVSNKLMSILDHMNFFVGADRVKSLLSTAHMLFRNSEST